MQVIYIDVIFFLNAVIDYLAIIITAKISSVKIPRWRAALAAAFGGFYSAAVALPAAGFLREPAVKLAAGIAMEIIAFWDQKSIIRVTVIFFAVCAAFGGFVLAAAYFATGDISQGIYIPVDLRILIASFAISYVLLSFVFDRFLAKAKKKAGLETVEVETVMEGKSAKFPALVDTGNLLTDPITGNTVIVVGRSLVKEIFPPSISGSFSKESLKDPVSLLSGLRARTKHIKMWLIPYSSVGEEGGLMAAFRPEKIKIGGREENNILIGISPGEISDGTFYKGIIGADRHGG